MPDGSGEGGIRDRARAARYAVLLASAQQLLRADAPATATAAFTCIDRVHLADATRKDPPVQPFGFVGVSKNDPQEAILLLTGSGTTLAWYDRLHVAFVPFPGRPDAGRVGYGYTVYFAGLRLASQAKSPMESSPSENLLADLRRVVGPKFRSLTVAGHGLGGALATIYAMQAASSGGLVPAQVYTFGSPRVGDSAFAAAYANLGIPTLQVANSRDLTQRIPAADYGYVHVGTPCVLDSLGRAQLDHECTHSISTYVGLLDPGTAPAPACVATELDHGMVRYLEAAR